MSEKRKDGLDHVRAELIRLKVDARQIPLHEWLERAYELLEQVERKAVHRDRLTRIVGAGRVVEVRGKE